MTPSLSEIPCQRKNNGYREMRIRIVFHGLLQMNQCHQSLSSESGGMCLKGNQFLADH
jgi:hypothetical protein